MISRLFNLLLLALIVIGTTIFLLVLIMLWMEGEDLLGAFALGAAWLIVLLLGAAVVWRRREQRQAAVLMSYLEQAVRLNLPWPRVFQAAEQHEQRPWLRRSLAQLREKLQAGHPLAEALAATARRLPQRTLEAIARAERSGRLAAVLPRLVRRRASVEYPPPAFYSNYPVIVLIAVFTITGWIMVFVMPKFQQIFHDFGATLPAVTRQLIAVARWIDAWALLILLLLVVLFLARLMAPPQRPMWSNGAVILPLRTRLWWSLPLVGFMQRNRALAEALETVADALHAGFPPADALDEARALCPDPSVRRRLHAWRQRLMQGESLADAARGAQLPPLVPGTIGSTRASEDLPDVLMFLSRHYSSRFSRAAALVQGAAVPVTVLLLGLAVAWVALAMFLPLIALIDVVSPNWSTL